MKTILFTGGGTAGHIMPNVALIEKLKDRYDCVYVGTDGMEKKLIKENFDDVTFFEIKAAKFARKLTLKNLLLPFKMLKSVKDCKKLMRQINPSLVFAKGGYVSYPVAKAAKKLKIPLFIHESDFSVGLANKLLLKKCDRFFTTFSDTAKKAGKKAVCTGSPIRQSVYSAKKSHGLSTMGFNGNRKIITIVGGSLGAKKLNDIVAASIDKLAEKYDVFLISGKGKAPEIKNPHFKTAEFCNDIFDVFAASDVVVTRGGSNALCELVAMKKPMLVIPLTSATRGEQTQNADYFFKNGCCLTADENNLTPGVFCQKIQNLFDYADAMKQNQSKIKIDGTDEIAAYIDKQVNS